ncbi:MAG: ATP-binding protein [Candidatus Omnitrophica bacterium]|nr:ATP-binding protein [Candidatus Omnitrophota bacterium]
MSSPKSSFLDKILGRIDRLHSEGLQTVVQRLARERSFLETLFNTIEDGVMVVDRAGRIVYFNQAVVQLLGLQPQDAEGQLISRYLPGVDWAKWFTPDLSEGKRVIRHEFEVNYPKHSFLRLYATLLEGGADGQAGVALILHDATEARKKTFEAIESERLQALTLLAASVAHEIGNPLNAINIHLQLMDRELKKLKAEAGIESHPGPIRKPPLRPARTRIRPGMPETVQKIEAFLAVAKGEITRLDYIITQFLEAIRPSPPRRHMTSLNEVVRLTLNLLRPELENRGLIVKEKLASRLPLAPLDAAQIKQALVNLGKNAMQAMTRGGTLTMETGFEPDEVWVSVADTGGGIPPEIINRIFEPFYTTKTKGTGLGLMIVQRIVRAHGGHIELESRVGQSASFRLRFPLHEPLPRLLEAGAIETARNDQETEKSAHQNPASYG